MINLRNKTLSNELDYGLVIESLKHYTSPRNKLSRVLRSGELVKIKKGLYVFGEPYRRGGLSMEILANMIYGPSYVSLEWALSYYGLIPEKVEEVTSVTIKRKKIYSTPVGRFSYEHSNSNIYYLGLTYLQELQYQTSLIASKEKAVIDQLIIRRGKITSISELENILFDDFRVDEEDIITLDIKIIENILAIYYHSAIFYLFKLLKKLQQ